LNYDRQSNGGHAGDTNVLYWSDVVGIPFIEADTGPSVLAVKKITERANALGIE
jgi:Glu-tRNA(Gln) amidotransferase subunit E-like FAD-binding protein